MTPKHEPKKARIVGFKIPPSIEGRLNALVDAGVAYSKSEVMRAALRAELCRLEREAAAI